jgi:hypothetical protein
LIRIGVVAAMILAVLVAPARAATEVNVVPHGQGEPGVPWAGLAGMLPPQAQALMYDRLTPLGANVPDSVLAPSQDASGYFKSARLLAPDDPSFLTDETVAGRVRGTTLSARIRRDNYGVPHVYADSDDGSCSARATWWRRIASCCWSRRAARAWRRRSACRA